MTQNAFASHADDEGRFIDQLRALYEDRGYAFVVQPQVGQLPDFLGSYMPDALAQKLGHNVVIEVKRTPGAVANHSLERIRRLFDGQAGWQFQVFFIGKEDAHPVAFPILDPAAIQTALGEVRNLFASGYRRAAFILAWSTLEAAFRLRTKRWDDRPLSPDVLVQTMAIDGWIEPDTERGTRALISLRNRIVHGDLLAEPTAAEVECMLSAVNETLQAEAV